MTTLRCKNGSFSSRFRYVTGLLQGEVRAKQTLLLVDIELLVEGGDFKQKVSTGSDAWKYSPRSPQRTCLTLKRVMVTSVRGPTR